ncbi:MAG: type II secretion system protein GspM [Burkholderiaceae bacterium]|jgi:type II secretory pathway component PulM
MSVNTSIRQSIDRVFRQADQRWSQLEAREQKLLTGTAALLTVLFIWLVLLDPAWTTLRKTRTAIPAALEKAGQAMQLAQELQTLQGKARKPVARSGDAKAYLLNTLAQRGWHKPDTLGEPVAGQFDIRCKSIPVRDTLEWLDDTARQPGMKLVAVGFVKREAGIVDLQAQFRLTDGVQP